MAQDDIYPLECPYCGFEQTDHEPERRSAEMQCASCENCGKTFWYSVKVSREYWSYEY